MKALVETLDACDKSLNSCEQILKTQDDIIEAQAEEIDLQSKRIGELEAEQDSIWSNPLVWFAIGSAAGIAGGALLSR